MTQPLLTTTTPPLSSGVGVEPFLEAGNLSAHRRPDGVVVAWLDVAGRPMNVLTDELGADLERLLERLATQGVTGLVLASGKESGFLAGADVTRLARCRSVDDAYELSRRAQALMDRVEACAVPVVAAIRGPCLGAGLELALATDARVASDEHGTLLGAPEVQLGLLPGAGGTVRLCELLGAQRTLELVLTGRRLGARQAKRRGLVDAVVPRWVLVEVAAQRALQLARRGRGGGGWHGAHGAHGASGAARGARRGRGRGRGGWSRVTRWLGADAWQRLVLESTGTGRNVLFRKASERTAKQTRGNYPAPHAILDVVRTGLEEGRDAGLAAERAAFARLSQTPASRALVRLFLGTKRLERQADELAAVHGPPRVARVSVIGAGLMGGGIAAVTAKAGIMVRLKDVDDHALAAGLSAVDAVLAERVRRRSTSAEDARRARLLVTATRAERGLAAADLVIEAVPEDLALKRSILAGLAAAARPDVVLASNTSSIPIARIAEALPDPSRLLGMHYFSPVAKMPLLEIVRTDATADDALAAALAVGRAQGKTPVVVRDGPGFYTTRILAAYLVEAVALLAEGVRPRAVDAALVDFGFPVGPLVVADEVGIDVAAKIAGVLREAFGERMEPPPLLGALLADGRVGRKGGSGFYRYDEGRRTDDERLFARLGITAAASEPDGEAIAKRCALRLVDEAVRCLEDGVLASPEDGDLAAVLGLGFPPFRGGPFRHVDAEGAERVVDDLRALRDRHGARFEPCGLLVAMASDPHRRFHDDERAAPA